MRYTTSVPFRGNLTEALQLAASSLTSIGFRIVAKDNASVEFAGPGMNSTRQSPLLGASRLRVAGGSEELSVDAELGGVERMSRFVRVFPIALNLVLLVVLVGVFAVVLPRAIGLAATIAGAATGANVLLWLLLAPVFARRLRDRSCRAIDTLMTNMEAVASDD
jgi:hypothetical protein